MQEAMEETEGSLDTLTVNFVKQAQIEISSSKFDGWEDTRGYPVEVSSY